MRSQASSQPRFASSSRMRINSGTAMAGCVSLSWMAAFSGSALQSDCRAGSAARDRPASRRRESTPAQSAALPHTGGVVGIQHAGEGFGRQRLGHGADEIAVAEFLEVEIVWSGGGPQPQRVDGLAAIADHRPIKGNPDQDRGLSLTGCSAPPRTSNEQFSFTSTLSCGRGTSHGSGRRSQLSGVPAASRLVMDCLNMPYS